MNKRQKELLQHQFDSEKAVLEQLEKQYQAALNDINRKIRILQSDEMTQSKIYRLEYQKALKKQVEAILEKLHGDEFTTIQEYLSASYTDAFIGTMYDLAGQGIPLIIPLDQAAAVTAILTDSKISEGLYSALGVDTGNLKKAISAEVTRGIASGMAYNDIARNISNVSKAPLSRAKTIVRTEGHRIQQKSTKDAQQEAKSKGADVVKQWDATLDGKTRPSHKKVDGEIRELDEKFSNGLDYPGDPSGKAGEVVNCRCVSLTRARWALDEDELKTLKERAAFFELDKAKTFEDFKEKYLTASKMAVDSASSNDWSKTVARTLTKAEKSQLIQYADDKGVVVPDLKQFDGDPELLKTEIDTLAKMQNDLPLGKRIVMSISQSLPDAEFANTVDTHITVNAKALRNRAITERNIAIGAQFASSTVEDIVVHEYGHIIATIKGNKGLEIAGKAYYNVFGKEASFDELLDFLDGNVSPYSTTFRGKAKDEYKRKYTEVISEVLAKNNSKPDDFTEEFVKLLKGGLFQ